ncbi:MAG: hypothetical protein WKF85_15475 [Chitinophagaceae bacterium]
MTTAIEKQNITTQEEAILHFIKTMDIEMINNFLDDNLTYQEFEKYMFISKLQNAFEQFRNFGDTKFITHAGECNTCNKGCKGISFIGNTTNNYMDIIVESAEGRIKDLYECADFKNENTTLTKNKRIYINKIELDDFLF